MDIFLTKIRLVNFKIFTDETISCNREMNIFVGDNASGKSSILKALDLALSGNPTKVQLLGLENLINVDAVSAWLSNPTADGLPTMRVELFFDMPDLPDFSKYNGEKYLGAGEKEYGIKMVCAPRKGLDEDLAKMIQAGTCKVFPFEFYEIHFSTFGDSSYSGYLKPCKFLYIDNTAIDTTKTLQYMVANTYRNVVDETERMFAQYDFRKHLSGFNLPQSAVAKDLTVSGDLLSCLDIKENGISLANRGEGKISICKTDCALERKGEGAFISALEEPENHLSYYNLRHLILMAKNRVENHQMFIVTHSSYVTSRLGLRNALFVSEGKVHSLQDLSQDTSDFFMKAPNDNLLQFVLSKKVLLVEGAAEFILMEKFIKKVARKEATAAEIWTIALNGLSFARYLEVGKLLDIKVAAIRDNDGKIKARYEEWLSDRRKVFSDPLEQRKTFEICLYQDNEEKLKAAFSDQKDVQNYMLHNKAEAAYRILQSDLELVVPQYIRDAIEWLTT